MIKGTLFTCTIMANNLTNLDLVDFNEQIHKTCKKKNNNTALIISKKWIMT